MRQMFLIAQKLIHMVTIFYANLYLYVDIHLKICCTELSWLFMIYEQQLRKSTVFPKLQLWSFSEAAALCGQKSTETKVICLQLYSDLRLFKTN